MVGAFITYERDSDIKKIQAAFSNQDPAQRNQAALSFEPQRPVDPSDIRWKNMQIKSSERMVRGFLVCLTLLGLLYISFLIQVLVSDWRFENARFERIDCGPYKQLNTRSIFQNKAYGAWTEYSVAGQWRADLLDSGNWELEQQADDSLETSPFANGTLACFCDAEQARSGWYTATFADYGYKTRAADGSLSADRVRLEGRLDAQGPR